jgi:hypothetical protein
VLVKKGLRVCHCREDRPSLLYVETMAFQIENKLFLLGEVLLTFGKVAFGLGEMT